MNKIRLKFIQAINDRHDQKEICYKEIIDLNKKNYNQRHCGILI